MERVKEAIQRRYKKATDALTSLSVAIENMKKVDDLAKASNEYPENIYKPFRDSMIQRFEYSFDQCWKFLNMYLELEGRRIDIKTPKSIFRECLKSNIITEKQCRLALCMVDHRNLTTHDYDEPLIEEISHSIPAYHELMFSLIQKTK